MSIGKSLWKYCPFQLLARRSIGIANVFNLNESILSTKFSKKFTQPVTPDNQKDSIDDGMMLKYIMQQEQNRLDQDKRSLYFRERNPDSIDWEVPRGIDLLVVYPGSWLRIFYKNNHEAEKLSSFGGVLVKVHENYQNGIFKMMGLIGGVVVMMQFMIYSPLIEKIEIHKRSIPTRGMEYLWDGPTSNFKGPTDSGSNEEEISIPIGTTPTKPIGSVRKKKNIKGPEIISKENCNLSIEERLANILPMEIPKGYEKIREMDEIERYTESLFQDNWTTTQTLK